MRIQKNTGEWTDAEDQIILKGFKKYGNNNWSKISSMLTRTEDQCRQRYENYLSPEITYDKIEFLNLCKKYPSQYVTISKITKMPVNKCYKMFCDLCLGEQIYEDRYIQKPIKSNGSNQILLKIADERIKNNKGRKEIKKMRELKRKKSKNCK